jgi:2-polyprenyl-6-methoxyphenol hydroxylase-like FAD-dependent oxidoreductase
MAGTDGKTTLKIAIVGAGPSGLLLALHLLQNRDQFGPWQIELHLFERESDHDLQDRSNPDRSYTIDITGHGLKAVRRLGSKLARRFDRELIPFNGIHAYLLRRTLPYDDDGGWTGSRGDICSALLHELRDTTHEPAELRLQWNCAVSAIDAKTGELRFSANAADQETRARFDLIVGADGAGSLVRRALEQQQYLHCQKSSIPNYSRILKLDSGNAAQVFDPSLLHMFSLMPWAVGGAILDTGPASAEAGSSDFLAANTPKQFFVQMGYQNDSSLNGTDEARQMLASIKFDLPGNHNGAGDKKATLLDFVSDSELASFAKRDVYHTGKTVICSRIYGGKCVLLGDAATAFPPVGQGVNAGLEAAVVLGDEILSALASNASPDAIDCDALVGELAAAYNHAWLPQARACARIANTVKYGSKLNMLKMLTQGIITQLIRVELTSAQLAKSSTLSYQSADEKARFRNRACIAVVAVAGVALLLL